MLIVRRHPIVSLSPGQDTVLLRDAFRSEAAGLSRLVLDAKITDAHTVGLLESRHSAGGAFRLRVARLRLSWWPNSR